MAVEVKKEEITKVFVYGTLKRGFYNNRVLGGSRLIRETSINGIMLHLGAFPGILECEGGSRVYGELYEVDTQQTWENLDKLEGHPNHFERRPIQIGEVKAFVYYYECYDEKDTTGRVRIIPAGRWNGPTTNAFPFLGAVKSLPVGKKINTGVIFLEDRVSDFRGTINLQTGEPMFYNGPKLYVHHDQILNKYVYGTSQALQIQQQQVRPPNVNGTPPWNGNANPYNPPKPYSYHRDYMDPGEEVVKINETPPVPVVETPKPPAEVTASA